ncbi:extracellular solute-binding protein [Paenibacillus sp. CGMCC 1.16610]|uniref:Extracellular solute-binding protein n=1 Tax=Paenibacillus anseongense TaxID=2682845 RepID=A0ABW9U4F2_9BACL|nr:MULTISPECIES: extracellular solute-binding protein [Paenibacillus]MBA2939012.1 extracellular solute-binding protein [Paenibacillus sp. CGMCC 1.16610]MVQ34974.1 extracellular solute-binding protein [Paenibacillus anseongense]
MKKWIAMLCVCALFVISACSGTKTAAPAAPDSKPTQPAPAPAAAGEKKKLSLWYIETGKRKELIEATIQQFMKDHPDVEVEAVQIPNDPYKTKLTVAMGGGNPPDIFHSWGGGWLKQFVSANQVLDLTGKISTDTFIPAGISSATFDNKVYGAPVALSLVPVYYNKEIFAKYNLQPPQTYDELMTIVEKLKKENIIPFALANKTKWPAALLFMYYANRLGGSEIFNEAFERKGRTFDDESYVKAGDMIQQLVKAGGFNPGFNGIQYDAGNSRQLMYTGKAAMEVQTSSYINNVRTEAPDFEKKLGMFPFPTINGGKGKITDVVGGVSPVLSVSSKTKYPNESVELIKALTSKELGQKLADQAGTISAQKGITYTDAFAKQLNDMLSSATSLQTFYDQTLPSELAELHKDTTQNIFGQTMTPAEAAKQMEAKAKEVLKK